MTSLLGSRRRGGAREDGSVAVVMIVGMVVTGLVLIMLATVVDGMRFSRRSGDSANALQVGDAGINDAIRTVSAQTGTTALGPTSVTLTGAGSYQYTAIPDTATKGLWHLSSVGTDTHGVQRKVKADAVAEKLFGSALFVIQGLSIPAGGTLDSFKDGLSLTDMCTLHGTVGSNAGGQWFRTSSGSGNLSNCQAITYSNGWTNPVDGCVLYTDQISSSPPPPTEGSGQCPSGSTTIARPAYTPPTINGPGGSPVAQTLPCDSTHTLPAQTGAQAGKPYYWTSVTLRPGCEIDPTNGPVVIYTSGQIDIGPPTGSAKQTVNQPPTGGACTGQYDPALTDTQVGVNNPSNYYCPGWSKNLLIYQLSGSTGCVTIRNHTQFWGLIDAPSGNLGGCSSGSPHAEVWGAILAGTAQPNAQISMHYDDSLGDLTTGRFTVHNWREEPCVGSCSP